jgi:nitrogen regulatory protein P-II 1
VGFRERRRADEKVTRRSTAGLEYNVDLRQKVKVETRAGEVLATLAAAARTGKIGDGKIFVFEVAEAIRIRKQ